MMQVAAEDTYKDYVICRGFDPRILKFIDYAAGDANSPGISVAKPFGKRVVGTYEIAEVYPALLPTQGNPNFTDFRQVTYVPPSPVAVNWRLGQNPGKVTSGGLEGGQPESLSDAIEILYDHNGKAVNWILMDFGKDGGRNLMGKVTDQDVEISGDFTGLTWVDVTVIWGPDALIATTVRVHDHSGDILDLVDLTGYSVWASETKARTLDTNKDCHVLTPKFWAAVNRGCTPNNQTYRECP